MQFEFELELGGQARAREVTVTVQQACCEKMFNLTLPDGLASLMTRVNRAAAAVDTLAQHPSEANARRSLEALTESDEPFEARLLARFLDAAQLAFWGYEGEWRDGAVRRASGI